LGHALFGRRDLAESIDAAQRSVWESPHVDENIKRSAEAHIWRYVDYDRAIDPYSPELSAKGVAQCDRLAQQCQGWDLQFLVVSTMIRAQQTADAIERRSPVLVRWDLEKLEEMNVGDLELDPAAGPMIPTWTPEQLDQARAGTWNRVMSALARIQIYAEANGLERIAIVAHGHVIKMLLLNWLGLDWRAGRRLRIPIDFGGTSKIVLEDEGGVRIEWINRQYGSE